MAHGAIIAKIGEIGEKTPRRGAVNAGEVGRHTHRVMIAGIMAANARIVCSWTRMADRCRRQIAIRKTKEAGFNKCDQYPAGL